MLFNSLQYFVFLAVVLLVHWSIRGQVRRVRFIVVASLLFYASWNPPFVALLLASVAINFACGQRIAARREQARRYLVASIVTNLGILAAFKYGDFLLENANALLAFAGLDAFAPAHDGLGLILPLGISFFTFQSVSYTIDVYRGQQPPAPSLWVFTAYVTFFPQLVAGPIVRGTELLPQLESDRTLDRARLYEGVTRIVVGLIKKVIVADWLAAVIVEPVFYEPHKFSGFHDLLAVYAYSIQIFCDFSGYVDIAIGSALLLGYRIPENFDAPYLAANPSEFWRRWHMTLSRWLRDYLYIPLGGNRRGSARTYANLLITMLLGGLWHGASWTFVVWGGLHGLMLAGHRLFARRPPRGEAAKQSVATHALAVWLTFNLTCFAWIFFRCPSLGDALVMIERIAGFAVAPGPREAVLALALAPALLAGYALCVRAMTGLGRWQPRGPLGELAFGVGIGCALFALASFSAPGAEFIYFQF